LRRSAAHGTSSALDTARPCRAAGFARGIDPGAVERGPIIDGTPGPVPRGLDIEPVDWHEDELEHRRREGAERQRELAALAAELEPEPEPEQPRTPPERRGWRKEPAAA
jgi:hypothetical protein